MSGIRATLDAQIPADDDEEAFTEAVACARCTEGQRGPGHLGVHGIVQSAIALGATVEIIGTAKRAGSVHKEHEDLALAESYRDNRPEAKQIFRNCYRVRTASPPMASFLNNYKAGTGAVVLNRC